LQDLEEVWKWEEKKRTQKEDHENYEETEVLEIATATLTVTLVHSLPLSLELWNCQGRIFVHLGAAGRTAQRGHVPLGL
jgi:hypothetical protein